MLVAAGKEVEIVVLLDPPTVNTRKSLQALFSIIKWARPIAGPVAERAMAWTWFRSMQLQKFYNYSWTKRRASIQWRWIWSKAKLGRLIGRGKDQVDVVPIEIDRSGTPILGLSLKDARTSRYATVMANYRPKLLDVPVLYVRVDFSAGAWRRVSPNLEVIKSPGTHEFPDLASVAAHLKERLQSRK